MTLLFAILTKNASSGNCGRLAYLHQAHILNDLNGRMYIANQCMCVDMKYICGCVHEHDDIALILIIFGPHSETRVVQPKSVLLL